jgi:hypothetical protein
MDTLECSHPIQMPPSVERMRDGFVTIDPCGIRSVTPGNGRAALSRILRMGPVAGSTSRTLR